MSLNNIMKRFIKGTEKTDVTATLLVRVVSLRI